VTGAEIVEEFLANIRNGVDIEDEEIGFCPEDDIVGLPESRRDIHLGRRGGLLQGSANFLGQIEVGLEHENASARVIVNRMARRGWVHNEVGAEGCNWFAVTRHALLDRCLLPAKWKAVFLPMTVEGRALSRPTIWDDTAVVPPI
jgi:hypothetical protein